MKYQAFQKHIQKTKLCCKKYYIEYKPRTKSIWCYYDCKWPNYHYTPILVQSILDHYPDCAVKVSRCTDESLSNDSLIVKQFV